MAYAIHPATLRLAVWVSVLGVAAAVALGSIGSVVGTTTGPAIVVAVMVVGCAISTVRTSRLPRAQPSWQAIRVPVAGGSRTP